MRVLPLNAIRAFATVGRLLSFSRAADELSVTPSAVSHQIRLLEDHLGVALLRRKNKHVALTPEGRIYLQEVSEGLTRMARASTTLKAARGQRILRVSVMPSLASLWLVPRIGGFAEAYPDIAIVVGATRELVDFQAGQFDVAIWHGQEPQPGYRFDPLEGNDLFPICSPKLLKGRTPLRAPADLRHHTLLESSDDLYVGGPNPGWQIWLQAAGVPHITSKRLMSFSPRHLMHRAVLEGLGVGLSRTLLVADALAKGQLVCPFGPVMSLTSSYSLVCPETIAEHEEVAVFREWLLHQARTTSERLKILPKGSK
ncbi:MAG: transcriptional regulator GcvA [Betaproteobacteria bacterium]|nr:transcriptional regulator GcvA [Betaproteobacteria bacterium]